MIDNLTSKTTESDRNKIANNQEPKHIILLKTLYGMADEMLSKNFLEEKKTNQKSLFDKDYMESSKAKDGRSGNFEDLLESLTEQLDGIDFTEDEYQEFSYIDQDPDRPSMSTN